MTPSNVSRALHIAALCYVGLVFFRPIEAIPVWGPVRLVLGASVAVSPLLLVTWWRRAALPVELPHDRLLLAYWVAIGVSNLASGWWDGALLGVEQFAPIVFFYFLLRTAITSPEDFRRLVLVVTAAMVFHAVGAIVQYQLGLGWGGLGPYIERSGIRSRSVGIFGDPNDLALGFLLAVPFLLAGVCGRSLSIRERVAAAGTAVPILIAFRYANSRGAALGLAVSVCVYSWRRFGSVVGSPIAVAALVALVLLAPPRMGMLASASEESAQDRIHAWRIGLDLVEARPVTGVGWNLFREHYVRSAHNSFVQAFAELGLFGGGCFVAMVYSFFWGLRRTWRTGEPLTTSLANWEHALTSAGAGFFVGSFFLSKQYSVLTFTLLALGATYVSIVNREGHGPRVVLERRQWLSIAAMTAAILVATWISVRLLTRIS